ncbi:hypothetical protein C8A00DRAFT_34665 [Chaetomidium leptoderma]|uniref:Uncharacterized protein n=1 Tax=Chaetomidium leptoderma TaxID=669021 RepID=A0AAN6VJU4_9PEZI|nr:hypothetical protein C8A00DRAFT_34665 [Chaetomidium leptoderma]
MADPKTINILSALTRTEDVVSRVMIETTYGLILETTADGGFDVRCRLSKPADNGQSASSPPEPAPAQPGHGYRYYIWPDYKTSFVWYKTDWAGNPGDETHVDQDDLKKRYGEAWERARDAWVDKYTRAFEAHECHVQSYQGPIFSTPDEQTAWTTEGVLLAAWLALQPGVDSVDFHDDGGACVCLLEKNGLAVTLASFLKNL